MQQHLKKTAITLATLALIACTPANPGSSAKSGESTDKKETPASPGSGSTSGASAVKVTQGGKSIGLPAGFGLQAQLKDTSNGQKFDIGTANASTKVNQIYLRAANKSDQILVEMGVDLAGKTIGDYRGKAVAEKTSKCTLIFYPENYGGGTDGMKRVGTIFPAACDIDISSGGAPLKGKITMGETTVELDVP